jgi:choline monooxygenase
MLNIHQDNVTTNGILPSGARSHAHQLRMVLRRARNRRGLGVDATDHRLADEIQQEDIAICERVQRGLRSRSYQRGRLFARRENGVHRFQGLLKEFLDRS